MRRLLALIFTLALAGCSTVSTDPTQSTNSFADFIEKIQTVTIDDANAALADVHAHGDVDLAALQCLPAIITFVQSSPLAPPQPNIKGVLSANQIKRDVLLGGVTSSGPFQIALRTLHVACAAYVNDEVRFAAQFAAMIGAASHGVPTGGLAVGPVVPLKALKP